MTGFYMSPTLHFRHQGRANIGWADGHIESRPMASIEQSNVYGVNSAAMSLGWFDPVDNSLFDLR
jgi:prepilin-type processing-associated H-X9-DG protein